MHARKTAFLARLQGGLQTTSRSKVLDWRQRKTGKHAELDQRPIIITTVSDGLFVLLGSKCLSFTPAMKLFVQL